MHDFLAFCGVHFLDFFHQGQRIITLERCLPCVYFLFCFDFGLRKKLLRLGTGLSSRAMVAPVDFRHVWSPFWLVE